MISIFVSFLLWTSAPTLAYAWIIPYPCLRLLNLRLNLCLNLPILDRTQSPCGAGPYQSSRPGENPLCPIFVSPTMPSTAFSSELNLGILNWNILPPYHTGEKLKLIQLVPFPCQRFAAGAWHLKTGHVAFTPDSCLFRTVCLPLSFERQPLCPSSKPAKQEGGFESFPCACLL